MILLVIIGIVVFGPLVVLAVRVLAKAHFWAIVVFLPAGLLMRHGPSPDIRLFALVTCVWVVVLAGSRLFLAGSRTT